MDTLKQKFLDFAKARANESKGTSYEWDFKTLYPEEKDIEYFLSVMESCPKYSWKDENDWDNLIDWFESLPTY